MSADSAKKTFVLRATALAALVVALFWGSGQAPAYQPIMSGGAPVSWRAGSPGGIWDDINKILKITFYSGNFPKGNWPTAAEAGAAVQNAGQTITDVTGKRLTIQRQLDSTTQPPVSRDSVMTVAFAPNEKSDFYGTDLSGANAVSYVDDQAGVFQDADIVFNGDPSGANWKVDATGSRSVQATGTHELVHSSGAAHSPYFNARVFPFARSPLNFLQDNATAPDDANYLRSVYGDGTASGTLTGSVTLTGGGAIDRAVVVATDANDVPQAIIATDAAGGYNGPRALAVPPGQYTLTVWHGWTSAYTPTYAGQDINFRPSTGATGFVNAITVGPVTVNAGANTVVPVITATAGTPTRWLAYQSLLPTGPEFQTLFVSNDQTDPTHTGTMGYRIEDAGAFSAANITSVSLGVGITVGGPITSAVAPPTYLPTPTAVDVFVPYTVTAGAAPGMRSLVINTDLAGNERLFIPGIIKVVGQGGLTIAASAGNPLGTAAANSAVDRPLLGLAFTANGTNPEDVRVRRLSFTLTGTGPTLPSVKLWVDAGTLGLVDGADTRIFSGAAYASSPVLAESIPGNPPGSVTFDNLALTIKSGTTVNLLLTADTPATGTGTYTASLDPIGTTGGEPNIEAHGMFWGDLVNPSVATITGGELSTDPLTLGSLEQTRFTGGSTIPVGGSTTEAQVVLKGVVTATGGNMVGMDVEVRPIALPFSDTLTHTLAANPGVASGTPISITVGGLTDPASYHWQARATYNGVPATGPWIEFGGNAVSAFDFSRDNTTTSDPTGLGQFDKKGTAIPVGPPTGLVKGKIYLTATNVASAAPLATVRLEVEVRPNGTPFIGVPNSFSPFVASGTSTATFSGPSGLYHWQARTTNSYGTASGWVNFNATTPHFDFKRTGGSGGGGGCGATVAGDGAGFWWGALALGLLLIFSRRRGV